MDADAPAPLRSLLPHESIAVAQDAQRARRDVLAFATSHSVLKELPRSHTQQEQEVAFSGRVGEGLSETTVKQVFGEFDYEFFPDLVIEMIHGTTEYQREWVPSQLGP